MSRGTINLDGDAAIRVSRAITHRRIEMGYRSARALGRETELDYRTITALEAGEPRAVDRNTIHILEVALNWPAGTLDAIIRGDVEQQETHLVLVRPYDIAQDVIDQAQMVAQAAFDAYIQGRTEKVK
jgi:hypothetical protein